MEENDDGASREPIEQKKFANAKDSDLMGLPECGVGLFETWQLTSKDRRFLNDHTTPMLRLFLGLMDESCCRSGKHPEDILLDIKVGKSASDIELCKIPRKIIEPK